MYVPTIHGPLPVLLHEHCMYRFDSILSIVSLAIGGESQWPKRFDQFSRRKRFNQRARANVPLLHRTGWNRMSTWEVGYRESLETLKASSGCSHLAGRHESQRPEGGLEIGRVVLEIVQSASDAELQLGRVLARRAVGRDLVELGVTHVGDGCRLQRMELRDGGSHELNFSCELESGKVGLI